MSKEREAREKREQQAQAKSSLLRKIVTTLLIVAAFGAVIYLGFASAAPASIRSRSVWRQNRRRCMALTGVRIAPSRRKMFESSFKYVPYVECGVPGSRDEAPVCKDAGIKHFPTWQFATANAGGYAALQALGSKTGCDLP